MRCLRALPIYPLMPAAGSQETPVATPLLGGFPGKIERPHHFGCPHLGHPIHHHVAGPSSVGFPWKRGGFLYAASGWMAVIFSYSTGGSNPAEL